MGWTLVTLTRSAGILAAEEAPAGEPQSATQQIAAFFDVVAGILNGISSALKETLGPPLKSIQHPIDVWLGGVPMWVAMACCLGLFIAALIWVWQLKRDFIYQGSPDQAWWRDLRLWATVVVIPYLAAYYFLGR